MTLHQIGRFLVSGVQQPAGMWCIFIHHHSGEVSCHHIPSFFFHPIADESELRLELLCFVALT